MESFRHSCPFCGQHIEYTVGYCGRQMRCPMCGQTVTFPAIPPRKPGDPALQIKTGESKPPRKLNWHWPAALAWIGRMKHWDVVAQCVVPFVLVVALLFGASYVKRKLSEPSGPAPDSSLHADPEVWQKMTDLTKADEAVRQRMQELDSARAALRVAQSRFDSVQQMDAAQRVGAQQGVARATVAVQYADRRFNAAMDIYQRLGGTINYRDQLQNR